MKYVLVIVAHCTKSYTERTCILAHFYIRVSLRIETKNKNKTRRKKKKTEQKRSLNQEKKPYWKCVALHLSNWRL